MQLTDAIRKKVQEEMGYEIEDEDIARACSTHGETTTRNLQRMLKKKEDILEANGGRGVELADEIDSIRIAIAVRFSA